MIIDFPANTIEIIVDGNSCGIINMTTAGLGGGQLLYPAFSAYDGASVRLIAPDPTYVPPVPASPILVAPSGFPNERLESRLSIVRSCSRRLNILLMGITGAGKSTFINTCYTSCLPAAKTDIEMIAYAHATKGHASTELKKYLLPSTNITLWDPWVWIRSVAVISFHKVAHQ
jgi:hypothetical protein